MRTLAIVVMVALLAGCGVIDTWKEYLPPEATQVQIIGHDWAYFTLHGRRYLVYTRMFGGQMAVTQITDNPAEARP